jgi:hypothetical protein
VNECSWHKKPPAARRRWWVGGGHAQKQQDLSDVFCFHNVCVAMETII